MSDPEQTPDEPTPASPSPAPNKAHGDAFADQSGSRQGQEPKAAADEEQGSDSD